MLFTGWEVRIVKTVTEVLKCCPKPQAYRGHSFLIYGPTLSLQITYFFSSISQIIFLILSLPPTETRRTLQMFKLTDVVKTKLFILIL